LRCARCGNDNPETNRFCGMCGATLLRAAVPAQAAVSGTQPAVAQVASTAAAGTAAPARIPQSPAALPAAPPSPERVPAISGPSFLGLNDPAPATRRRGSLSIDPDAAPSSRSLEYLLEDDEEPRRGGAGKFLLILVALALAVGFGYLRWKNQGLPWLGSGAAKPAAVAPGAATTDSNSSAGSSAPAEPASTSSAPAATPPVTDATGGGATANPAASTAANPSQGNPHPDPASVQAGPASGDGAEPISSGAPGSQPSAGNDATATVDIPPTTVLKPKPAPAARAEHIAKPPAAVAQPRIDPVSEARKYLYGQKVPQNCERGLRMLKPLADQANPKAMIEMGALYSAGLCTPRDLPTAYRWFALSLRKEPENVPLQADLQKLWGEMTQPERQLAIKLSQ
jgi:hypothetical protein